MKETVKIRSSLPRARARSANATDAAHREPETSSARMLQAAERLFALHGLDGVSVRDIAREAKLNNAGTFNYYFRSKQDLIDTLIVGALRKLNARCAETMRQVPEDAGLSAIVSALMESQRLNVAGAAESYTSRFLAMSLQSRLSHVRALVKAEGLHDYDDALARIRARLDFLPEPVVKQRLVFLFWSMTAFNAAHEAATFAGVRSDSLWLACDAYANFAACMIAMLAAPVL
ncbi:MAG: TetR/AcrR family transcriptional regulator [Janthinobacterium lividum]